MKILNLLYSNAIRSRDEKWQLNLFSKDMILVTENLAKIIK